MYLGRPLGRLDEAERLSDRLVLLHSGTVRATGTTRTLLCDLVGEHAVVMPQDVPEAAAVSEWLRERRMSPSSMLDEWHIAMDAAGLAGFVAPFGSLRYDVRPPTLDDLFLALEKEARR